MKLQSFTLENEWIRATVINYGARLQNLVLKKKQIDVAVGFDRAEDYLLDTGANFGAVIGRYANRIAGASFTLSGKTYHLPQNNGNNCLHGGNGFAFRFFSCIQEKDRLICRYTSPDQEEGFPGNLRLQAEYVLDGKTLKLRYQAFSDRDTVCNITNHTYFNLNGGGSVLDHVLQIDADRFLPIDENTIPLQPMDVAETPFDFRKPAAIGTHIDEPNPQLIAGGGYDHNYILNGSGFRKCASLFSPNSQIQMDVFTDKPGMQLYTANFMNAERPLLKGGARQKPREAVCLETQFFPDTPNRPDFPSCILAAGEEYHFETHYEFSWK